MYVKSKLFESEKMKNLKKKAAANKEYYQAFVEKHDGTLQFALFTEFDIARAIKRGDKNPEDKGIPSECKKSWWKFWKS